MGLDEKVFSIGYRLFKKLTAEPRPPYFEDRAELKDLEPRLQIIAKSLCGEPIQIHEAEKIGGFSGVHFYFPKSLCPLPGKEFNECIYIQRVLFYSSAKQLGFCLPPQGISLLQKRLYTCLAIHQIYQHIVLEFPGAKTVLEKLSRQTKEELRTLSTYGKNTQNGLLAQWIYEILSQEYRPATKEILCQHHTNAFGFWKYAEDIYKKILAPLPPGPELADEAFVLWGYLMPPYSDSDRDLATDEEDKATKNLPTGTEIEGKSREEVVKVQLETQKKDDNPVFHSFEKVETLEEYQGGFRTHDGDDELAEHAEALEDLNMTQVTRSRERVQSLYKADIRLHGDIPDVITEDEIQTKSIFLYPEWDYKKKSYKIDWCRIEERILASGSPFSLKENYGSEKREITKLFEQVRHQPLWRKRQKDGSELDIDVLVNRFAELKSGHSKEDRFYLRSEKHKKDWQCILLIDASLSTDSWIANERIMDVIKNSVSLIGEALGPEFDKVSVAAFHSNTRHQCVYQPLKDFSDPWRKLQTSLGALEPEGYTRIGPALRHSLSVLKNSNARHKMIVLLSDGKASDYDHYEGRYGMEDVKQSLREAHQQKVHVKCLAVEERAKFYLPQMFGSSNIEILSSPRKLPQALTKLLMPLLG